MISVLETHNFGHGDTGCAFLGEGWDAPEADFVWSTDYISTPHVKLPAATADLSSISSSNRSFCRPSYHTSSSAATLPDQKRMLPGSAAA